MDIFWNFSAFIILVTLQFSDCTDQNKLSDKKNGGRKLWPAIRSPRKIQDFHNFSVYLGYANNPFGPSTRVLNKTKFANIFEASQDKASTASISNNNNLNEIIFNPIEASVDSGSFEPETSSVSQEQRSKRGVVHLYNMVSCATGCNPLIYKGYGCYCGFLGSGYAVDGIDRCCKMHDWCYDTAKCPMFLEYFVPYMWKCYRNRPLCAISHGEWGGPGSCAQRLCECDRALSECLRRYPCPSSRALCKSSPWRLIQNALMIF